MSNAENKNNVLDFLVNSVYKNFPEDLRKRMIKSADQIMDIGVGDKMLEYGDGLNAKAPFLYAALLKLELAKLESSKLE